MSIQETYDLPIDTVRFMDLMASERILKEKYGHFGYEDIRVLVSKITDKKAEMTLTMNMKGSIILPMFKKWAEKILTMEVSEFYEVTPDGLVKGRTTKELSGMSLIIDTEMEFRPKGESTEYFEQLRLTFSNQFFGMLASKHVTRELTRLKASERDMFLLAI